MLIAVAFAAPHSGKGGGGDVLLSFVLNIGENNGNGQDLPTLPSKANQEPSAQVQAEPTPALAGPGFQQGAQAQPGFSAFPQGQQSQTGFQQGKYQTRQDKSPTIGEF